MVSTGFNRLGYHDDNAIPYRGEVYVYSSNLAGIHDQGTAASAAQRFGAQWAKGVGRVGQSYGIPIANKGLARLPLLIVRDEIDTFLDYARRRPNEHFFVTRIGCGPEVGFVEHAAFRDEQIAPFFTLVPSNCSLPERWRPYVDDVRYEVKISRPFGTDPQ